MEEVATAFDLIRGVVSVQSKTTFELGIKLFVKGTTRHLL